MNADEIFELDDVAREELRAICSSISAQQWNEARCSFANLQEANSCASLRFLSLPAFDGRAFLE